jgi:L,D-transpeptidase catalytic domain
VGSQIPFSLGRYKTLIAAPGAHRPSLKLAAAIAVAGLLGVTTPAAAYTVFWPNQTFDEPDSFQPAPAPVHRPRAVKRSYPRMADAPKDIVKPRGPLIIAISIEKQRLKIYDANGLFAESPVSTGKAGHSTPMGVFSVIQKSKWHRSNLYSDAPMPYMQRITWSGVALHAGVVPGYPASHGCIRMPMAFATKLWSWSKLGARVIIAPGEVTPSDIAHPMLITRNPAAPSAALQPVDTSVSSASAAVSDKNVVAEAKSSVSSDVVDLRVAPKNDASNASPAQAVSPSATDRIRIADAQGAPALPQTSSSSGVASVAGKSAAADSGKDESRASGTADDLPPKDVLAKEPAKDAPQSAEAPPPATVSAPKRTGHIAVLISRKDSRIYVRQNFEPLFDMPVTIAQSDRPLGTHVFTALADGSAPNVYHWSVVSLPSLRDARAEDMSRRRRSTSASDASEPAPAATATEALDRLTIPDDAKAKIASALASGGSMIVSDQGLGSETGLGTDFIVPLR